MTWTMAAVRDGLKARLATVTPTLTVYDTMPTTVMVPAATIAPSTDNPVSYDDTEDGAATLRLTVLVLVQKVVESVAQDAADAYIDFAGASSIPNALNAGALASAWEWVVVKGATHYGQYTFGSGDAAPSYVGIEFAVEVGVY